ncbi:unnamed protein product [Lampetra fluviatilis]
MHAPCRCHFPWDSRICVGAAVAQPCWARDRQLGAAEFESRPWRRRDEYIRAPVKQPRNARRFISLHQATWPRYRSHQRCPLPPGRRCAGRGLRNPGHGVRNGAPRQLPLRLACPREAYAATQRDRLREGIDSERGSDQRGDRIREGIDSEKGSDQRCRRRRGVALVPDQPGDGSVEGEGSMWRRVKQPSE